MNYDFVAWLVFAVAALLVGLVSAVEVALTGADRSNIRKLAETGDREAATVESLLEEPARFWLTAMLMKSIGLLAAGVAVGRVFTASGGIGMVVLATLIAWLVLGAAQIAGRSLAAGSADPVALRLAPFANSLVLLLSPFTFLLYRAGKRMSGEDPAEPDHSIFLSEYGLRRLMQVDEESTTIEESEKAMIAGILDMNSTVAREVMVPRIDMVTLPVESTLQESLDEILACGHSRIPVYEENVDVIVGLLYAKDLLRCFRENRTDVPIRELLRPAYFVPASKKVDQLLHELQQQRIHLAMVVDEYGGIAGLVTIEDIMEEIFGEIQDEYDTNEQQLFQRIGENSFIINSRLDIYTLGDLLEIDVSDEDADTVGGLIYSRLDHVPVQGESVELDGWRLRVLSLEGRRINQVRADRIPVPPGETADEEDHARLRRSLQPRRRPALDPDSITNRP